MRLRSLWFLAALFVGLPAWAWTTIPGGDVTVSTIDPVGQRQAYAVFTAAGVSWLTTSNCAAVKVRVLPSIAAAATGTPSIAVWDCAAGTTALDTAGKRLCTQLCGSAGCTLDGNSATGTDTFYGVEPTLLAIELASHPGGAPAQQVAVEARCNP